LANAAEEASLSWAI